MPLRVPAWILAALLVATPAIGAICDACCAGPQPAAAVPSAAAPAGHCAQHAAPAAASSIAASPHACVSHGGSVAVLRVLSADAVALPALHVAALASSPGARTSLPALNAFGDVSPPFNASPPLRI